jgi:hypothetical protein
VHAIGTRESPAVPRKVSIPAYRLHRGSGQAVVRIDGRDQYLGVHGSTESKERYREITKRHLADQTKVQLEHSVRFHVDITVAEIVAKYLVYVDG